MDRYKKAVAALLAWGLILSLALCGCGAVKAPDREDAGNETAQSEAPEVPEASEPETDAPEAEVPETDAPEAEVPSEEKAAYIDLTGVVDFDGEAVPEELFSAHRLTMVNVWGTFCQPCIAELPMLEEMNAELAEKDVAIVGLLGDALLDFEGNYDEDIVALGKEILEDNGVTYPNFLIAPAHVLALGLEYFPTSVLVDADGKIVGTLIIGALPEEDYLRLIDEALATLPDES